MNREEEMKFDLVFETYYKPMVNYCESKLKNTRISSEEIVADIFEILASKWNVYKTHTQSAVLIWLYRAADNVMKNELKRKQLDYDSLEELQELEGSCEVPKYIDCDRFDQNTYELYIQSIMKRLKPKEKLLFDYIVVLQYSYEKTAKIMNLSVNALKLRWYRIRDKIGDFVTELF